MIQLDQIKPAVFYDLNETVALLEKWVIGADIALAVRQQELADDFDRYREARGSGDPEAPPHRKDDPMVLRAMRGGMATIEVRPGPSKIKEA